LNFKQAIVQEICDDKGVNGEVYDRLEELIDQDLNWGHQNV